MCLIIRRSLAVKVQVNNLGGGFLYQELIAVVVDSEPVVLSLIEEIAIEVSISVIGFINPDDALLYINENGADIVITGARLREANGVDFIKTLNQGEPDLPIIAVIPFDDYTLMSDLFSYGITGFVQMPVNAVDLLSKLKIIAELRRLRLARSEKIGKYESESVRIIEKIKTREREAILLLSHALEANEPTVGSHVQRVGLYSKIIAQGCGVDEETIEKIYYASLFHDIGFGIASHELDIKETPLSEEEKASLREHALIGSQILDGARNDYLHEAGLVALTHHERFDGSGYPRGLKGDQIPLCGRIVAIADVFDSITSPRPYREPWDFSRAVEYIKEKRNTSFDPFLVDVFLRSINHIREVFLAR